MVFSLEGIADILNYVMIFSVLCLQKVRYIGFYEEEEYIRTFFDERYDYMVQMCQQAFPDDDDVENIADYYLKE